MSMSDPISDMLTRIRNAQLGKQGVCRHAVFEGEGGHRRRC
jgi:ribosomal protein S8